MSQSKYCRVCETSIPCKWLTCPNRNGDKHNNGKETSKGNSGK